MKILVFGNELVDQDNLALKLAKELKEKFPQIEFIEADSTENLEKFGKDLKIIDVSPGIEEVKIFDLENENDLEKLQTAKIFSMHDFDLGYNLKLLRKINKINSAKIICLPMKGNEEEIKNQLQSILRKWVAQLIQGS